MKDLSKLDNFNYKCELCLFGTNLKMDFSEAKAHSASYDALKTAEAFCLMMNSFG